MIKKIIKDIGYRFFPKAARRMDEDHWLVKNALQLSKKIGPMSLEEKVSRMITPNPMHSNQKFEEILGLLHLLQKTPPKVFCEIGDAFGGTLALFCQVAAPGARAITLDLAFTAGQKKAAQFFRAGVRSITHLAGDSHSPTSITRFQQWLGSDQLDFLFIDGDHTYQGVDQDFKMYSPFVRPGGIVAFHDICPDFSMRHGIKTKNDVGAVPSFWAKVKSVANEEFMTLELIEDPEQDGFGNGILQKVNV